MYCSFMQRHEQWNYHIKGKQYTFKGDKSVKLFCALSLKGLNMLAMGAEAFFLEKNTFQKWIAVQESKQEI